MIFLTEGDSASGTITKTRDVMTQAVFSLRGKILNVYGRRKPKSTRMPELYNMRLPCASRMGWKAYGTARSSSPPMLTMTGSISVTF
jgi:DNA gyrase/topoisomerase IV subunit B